jgi:hypothetical protein
VAKPKEDVLKDKIAEQFLGDGDLANVLDLFARGLITNQADFADRVLFLKNQAEIRARRILAETCDCETCLESDSPCAMDCDADELCSGCRESAEESKDQRFECDRALGRPA